MPDYSDVDFSKSRRPKGVLTPTDIDDVQKFILNPLQDAGFELTDWVNKNYKSFVMAIRNEVFDYEYTKGQDKNVFKAIESGFEETDDGNFDDISEKGVDKYINALKKRDIQQTKIKRRGLTRTLLQSTETPFKKLPPKTVSDIVKFTVGGRRKTRRRMTQRRLKTRKHI